MDRFVNKKIEKQTIYEIYRACRLCGAGGGYKMPIIQNVVNLDSCDVELKQKIRECVQIEVHQDDKMPPLICELCVDKVNDFYEFLEMCRQTNKRTRLKLGLPPQMLPRGAPDAGDCILGVTEPIFVNDEDSNEPLSDKRNKGKGVKLKKEPQKKWKEVNVKIEDKTPPREFRSSRHRAASPPPAPSPRLRRDKRPDDDNTTVYKLQARVKKSLSPPPKSILKKGNKPEASPQSPSTRLKRSQESDVKQETPAKRVKISLKPLPARSPKLSPRPRREEAEMSKAKQKQARQKESKTPCLVCGSLFKTPQAMLSHRRCHVVTYTHPRLACNACELWFPGAEEAEAHHKRHRRQPLRYRCRRCAFSATTLQAYEEHIENGRCLPWDEVPDVKCNTCWKTFPTQNLLKAHRCLGIGARPGKCAKCGRNYATQKTLASHTRFCKKGDVNISPELRRRLKPIQVRVAKCDPLLANVTQKHYDVSSVGGIYGLDKNCVYPYISSGLRIKSEPSDCMVKINELDFTNYVHWDSDDDSGDSESDHLDSLDVSAFMKKWKVESLAACALKVIFSSTFLGKVPRKFRKLKIEMLIDSALNDSLSELNLNDGSTVSLNKEIDVSDDNVNTSDPKVDEKDDDLFPNVNSDVKVTNDDFDSLFSDNNDNDNSAAVSKDKSVLLSDKSSDENKMVKHFVDLDSATKESLNEEIKDNVSLICNDNKLETTESSNENIERIVFKGQSLKSEKIQSINVSDDNVNYSEQKLDLETDINSDLEKGIADNDETKLNKSEVVNFKHNQNINRVISDVDQQIDTNTSEELVRNYDSNISSQSKSLRETDAVIHTEINKVSFNTAETLEKCTNEMDTEITKNCEPPNNLSDYDTENQNKNKNRKDDITEQGKNNSENNVDKNLKVNDDKTHVNGEADIDDIALNMNDLEELSGTEFDDCELMAEIDAQIGEKKREAQKQVETDDLNTISKKATENQHDFVNKHEEIEEKEKEICVDKIKNTVVTKELVKEKEEIEIHTEIKEDIIPKQDEKSMDLDNISDDEFDFND